MRGDVATAPDGATVVLVDIGHVVLLDNDEVRVWEVSLDPGSVHPWHLHHNPYVVLSLRGSEGRMDWLDGSPSRFISEYTGGAVYRPVSPIHRLTNIGQHFYRNRLVELKALGERLPSPLDVGDGARSVEGDSVGRILPDTRVPVIDHGHVRVWTVVVESGSTRELGLTDIAHVLALVEAPTVAEDATGGVLYHGGGAVTLTNNSAESQTWFITELTYLADLETVLGGTS